MRIIQSVTAILAISAGLTVAQADTGSASGVVAFDDLPGYGYAYSASWQSTLGTLSFQQQSTTVSSLGVLLLSGSFTGLPTVIDAPSFDIQAKVEFRFIDLATGATTTLPLSTLPWPTLVAGNTYAEYKVSSSDVQLRFSNPVHAMSVSFTDGNGAPVLGNSYTAAQLPTTLIFEVKEHFIAGNYLSASDDPTCASLSCMTAKRDVLNVGSSAGAFSVVMQPVPEPQTMLLMLGGLLAVGLHRRRAGQR